MAPTITESMIRLCDRAIDFHNDCSPIAEKVYEALADENGSMNQQDWQRVKDTLDQYTDGLRTIMNALMDYIQSVKKLEGTDDKN
ncbi:MAG TPA: hypothetical protein DCW90_17830 [Lachnospiraceae bacterium]|nr:hypothetical protein [Lachnospiraceae bacterium]